MKKIILSGGGTAGHVIPNLALLPYLSGCEIHYIGGNGIEKELVEANKNVTYHQIPCVKYVRGSLLKNLTVPFKLLSSIHAAKKLLRAIAPDVIFCKGGYVSLPVALAAKNVPLITHESDFSLGLTNKLIKNKCRYVCASFPNTAQNLKNGVFTGAILRREIYLGVRTATHPTLLIMGGSLGSKAISDCVTSCISELTNRYDVVHIVGKGKLTGITADGYTEIEFCSDMPSAYANADLIISRGGANALFEIAALRKKALIIPLPKGASRGDQVENAEFFANKNLIKHLPQSKLNPHTLISELESLESFTPSYFNVDGTKKVAKLILSS
ncbi:MAG: UDP-N-acetylglucosamine--N-acetylmuramyl-(pentapeptide) pyrophosphoryl-undecaprenol N-acetylglucosamine transferase [Clostridia bacterium]|nr:UDP-N-acetylglucosamine--N-acetylmuramyl-(pentapeptide) pyrophosphoryl-undecaprenol N-acetylglucosamine transferase [Clostridia bacterium]